MEKWGGAQFLCLTAIAWPTGRGGQELKQTLSDRGSQELLHESPLLEKEAVFRMVNHPELF